MPLRGSDVVLYEKKGRIAILTMNRPERMNALGGGMGERLAECWADFAEDENLWVAILTGTGERAFSAGADLRERAEADAAGMTSRRRRPLPTLGAGLECWKPTIAAINGYAIAGGWMLAQRCDIRIAAEHAELGIAEARWNISAGWICDLTRIIGLGHALEIVLWGDKRITAQRAYEIGFVNKVVSKEQLMDEAMSWAERMLELAPQAVRNFKEILYRGYHLTTEEGLALARHIERNLMGMEDSIEGPKAFSEKRKPVFKGR
ncbi:MAG: enoyl-CoA hydratase/isomerase family protein [Candidatus Tectomicrobia bacterium]|nr:enoyl-CoA hydratase/isomerase family protein [Candidatus Tectomicrobia bacterium]